MKQLLIVAFLFGSLGSCAQEPGATTAYPVQVGDITYDPGIDEADFRICDESRVLQYYNFGKGVQYKGEKPAINEHFQTLTFQQKHVSGFLTIRFIVNCKGESGRFRIQSMDLNYQEVSFPKPLIDQVLQLTRKMEGWLPGEYDGKRYDYYQYLTFKIENGELIEIMP